MDGSGSRPQREEPNDHDVVIGDNRAFIVLVLLSAVVAGSFFYIHRRQALDFVCLMETGQACDAALPARSSPP